MLAPPPSERVSQSKLATFSLPCQAFSHGLDTVEADAPVDQGRFAVDAVIDRCQIAHLQPSFRQTTSL